MFENFAAEVRRLAAAHGDKLAVDSPVRTLNFIELAQRSERTADALVDSTSPGARVAILDKNSCEILEMFFGCSVAGRVLVPLNWRLAVAELADVLRHAQPELAVVSPEFADHAARAIERAGLDLRVVAIDPDPTAAGGYERWLADAPAISHAPVAHPDVVVSQMYTSGTAGVPKGVLGTHRSVGAGLRSGDTCHYTTDSVLLCAMPMFHIGGMQPALIALVRGGTVILRRDIDPAELLETIEARRVSHGFLVPTVISMLVEAAAGRSYDLSSVRGVTYGASPITPTALTKAVEVFGPNLIQIYGSTETCGAISQLDAEDHHATGPKKRLLRSAGKPYPWVEVRIADLVTGEPLPAGNYGEILLRSDQNTPGYAGDTDATSAALDADGWLHTGDGGYVDEAGYIFLTDRVKDMVITGGENVYPTEVEAVIDELPSVGSVAVIGVPDPHWGERVVAVIVPATGVTIDGDAIIAYCRERLAGYKCPKEVQIVAALPLTASGKILKRELRARVGAPRPIAVPAT